MLEKYSSGAVQIDLETWERSALFHLFNAFSEPFHGVCLRVDCTDSFRFAKQSRISVFLTLVHRALIAAHQVENLMTRICRWRGMEIRNHTWRKRSRTSERDHRIWTLSLSARASSLCARGFC
jgi:chloramphenicol O-acetyltransferase